MGPIARLCVGYDPERLLMHRYSQRLLLERILA